MKGFIFGIIFTIAVMVVGVFVVVTTGSLPVATSSAPLPFEKTIASMALNARVKKEMPKTVPIQANDENLIAGARLYNDNCAVCHGLPGQPQTAVAKGMFPEPPEMFKKKGVTDDPPGETYWKVANGIRLTGMPGFKGELSDTQLWQVSLLLANADKISQAVKDVLAQQATAAPNPVTTQ
jgi:mono/diheme cytochrome c family protein